MISKTFPGIGPPRRIIKVEISGEYIDFSFVGEIDNQWFYDIPVREWYKDESRNWREHMREKRWFSPEIEFFIDASVNQLMAVA